MVSRAGEAAGITYNALLALQHRGQEGAGIALLKDSSILCHKDVGLVSEVFSPSVLSELPDASEAIEMCIRDSPSITGPCAGGYAQRSRRDTGPVSYTHLDVYKRQVDRLRQPFPHDPVVKYQTAKDFFCFIHGPFLLLFKSCLFSFQDFRS